MADVAEVRVALQFQPQAELTTVDALVHLLYGLELLYADSFTELPVNSHRSRWDRMWAQPAREWMAMLKPFAGRKRFESFRPPSPPAVAWPSRIPTPFIEEWDQLHVRNVVMASPLELLLVIPGAALGHLGLRGLLRFIRGVEQTWNAPKRIRVEGAQLDREYWDAKLDAEQARRRYFHYYHEGFDLLEGSADLADAPELPPGEDEEGR